MESQTFKSLPIGAHFHFASEYRVWGWAGNGPYTKESPRCYRSKGETKRRQVGNIHVQVSMVEDKPEPAPLLIPVMGVDMWTILRRVNQGSSANTPNLRFPRRIADYLQALRDGGYVEPKTASSAVPVTTELGKWILQAVGWA